MSEIRRAKQLVARCAKAVERAQVRLVLADRAENDAIRRNASERVLRSLSARVVKLAIVYREKVILSDEAELELGELEDGGIDMESEEE